MAYNQRCNTQRLIRVCISIDDGYSGMTYAVAVVPVKSNVDVSTITRAVLSPSHETNWAADVGVAAAAEPPPVVP